MTDIIGTSGDDTLLGTAASEVLKGLGGDDRIAGGPGNDTLIGGAGADTLHGGGGEDLIKGGAGDDDVSQLRGGDHVYGGAGDDIIGWQTFAGDDPTGIIDGGGGDDFVEFVGLDLVSKVLIRPGAGDDIVTITGVGVRLDLSGGGHDQVLAHLHFADDGAVYGKQVTTSGFDAGDGGDVFGMSLLGTSWDQVSNPFTDGYERLVQRGNDVLLQVSIDAQPNHFKTVAVFQDEQASAFTKDNFGWNPVVKHDPADAHDPIHDHSFDALVT